MEKSMIVVVDDLMNEALLQSIPLQIKETKSISEASAYVYYILSEAGNHFDLSLMKLYECWSHHLSRPLDWHYDKDEKLYAEKKELRFPLCSCVFYPVADDNLVGGQLMFKNQVVITPKRNRLVVFSPGLYHGVQQFRGKRTSININPWIDL